MSLALFVLYLTLLTMAKVESLSEVERNQSDVDWLLSSLPESVADSYPNFSSRDLTALPPDIVLRLPGSVLLDNKALLSKLISERPEDELIVRKVLTVMKNASDGDKTTFLDSLSNTSAHDWTHFGHLISFEKELMWWESWPQLLSALTQKDFVDENRLRLLLELNPEVYVPCSLSGARFCLGPKKLVQFKPFLTTMARRMITKHWPKLEKNEKVHRFRFWNTMLIKLDWLENQDMNSSVSVAVATQFLDAFYVDQVERFWLHITNSSGSSTSFDVQDMPLLWLLAETEISKTSVETSLLKSISDKSQFEVLIKPNVHDMNATRNDSRAKWIDEVLQSRIRSERFCKMSIFSMQRTKTNDTIETLDLECLSWGQLRFLVNKYAGSGFLREIPVQHRKLLFSHHSRKALSAFGLIWFKEAKLNDFQAQIIANEFGTLNDANALKKLLTFSGVKLICGFLTQEAFDQLNPTDLLNWSKSEIQGLRNLPIVKARVLLSKAWQTFSQSWDAKKDSIFHNLIHGLTSLIVQDIRHVMVERVASNYATFLATLGGNYDDEMRKSATMLSQRLLHELKIQGRNSSRALVQLMALPKRVCGHPNAVSHRAIQLMNMTKHPGFISWAPHSFILARALSVMKYVISVMSLQL
jgi:hypothetical protein